MRMLPALFVTVLCASACAGSSSPADSPDQTASSNASPAPETEPAAEPESTGPSIESQREPFMETCMSRAQSPDYCDCAFRQFAEVFKDADLSQALEPDDPRLKELHAQTVAQCAGKLDEAQVKELFIKGCTSGDQRKSAYCKCAWPALRKHLAVADFIGQAETPRFVEATKAMVATCKGKLPTAVARDEFMEACTKDDPGSEKRCKCLWKKIRAKFSTEEIAAGVADVASVPGLSACK